MTQVSILIPCYNAERYLASTIRSAICQLPPDQIEILLWDDGSTDNSVVVAQQFADHVRVLGDGINRGGNVARQRLTEAANGQWLQYLDADDVILPGKISDQLAWADEADVIYAPPIAIPVTDDRWRTIDGLSEHEWLNENATHWVDELSIADSLLCNQADTDQWTRYIRWGDFQTTSMLFRRETVEHAGGWKLDQPRCQEHELILRLLIDGARFRNTSNQKTLYRVHDGVSVSRKNLSATVSTRMELTDRAESHLKAENAMTPERKNALRTARLEAARKLYQQNRREAFRWFRRAGRAGILSAAPSDALPIPYRLCAATMGFTMAEAIAGWRRKR